MKGTFNLKKKKKERRGQDGVFREKEKEEEKGE